VNIYHFSDFDVLSQYLTSIRILTSLDKNNWIDEGVFNGNSDPDSIVSIILSNATVTRYVKIEVVSVNNHASARWDVLKTADQAWLFGRTWPWHTTYIAVGRYNVAAASLPLQGLVFFAGGWTGQGTSASRDVDMYNASSNMWTVSTTGLSQGRFEIAAASLPFHGLVFFGGGWTGQSVSRVVDVYNASSNMWTAFATGLSSGRKGLAAASLPLHGLVFFAGGWFGSGNHHNIARVVDVYNANSNTWTVFSAGLSEGRDGLSAASLPLQGLVFFTGGSLYYSRSVDIYNASSNTWTTFATGLSQGHLVGHSPVSASLPFQGLVFFAGGYLGSSSHSRVVDVYNVS